MRQEQQLKQRLDGLDGAGFGDAPFRVSVAMATYNGARFVAEQLDSLAAQTLLPLELVVSDDGSSDATVQIVSKFAETAPFPVVLHQNEKNLGFADNFLKAAELCAGSWIAFCDQDDVWEPEKLMAVSNAAARDRAIALVAHRSRVLRGGQRTEQIIGPQPGGERLPLSQDALQVYNGHCLVFRRILLDVLPAAQRPFGVHRPEQRVPHDDWITFLANALGKTFILSEPLLCYRMHEANVSQISRRREGMREYLRRGVKAGADEVEKRRRAAQDRAAQLRMVKTPLPYVEQNARQAAIYYQSLADLYARRAAIWHGSTVMSRAWRFARLVREGLYLDYARGGIGRREAFKDALFGVLRKSP
jgi:glycosyltransferase involved in cell wall biosynthesis